MWILVTFTKIVHGFASFVVVLSFFFYCSKKTLLRYIYLEKMRKIVLVFAARFICCKIIFFVF